MNETHIQEDWRERLVKESRAAKAYRSRYDYLIEKKQPKPCNQGTCKVKYYTGSGWTVIDKRMPGVSGQRPLAILTETESQALLTEPTEQRNATHTCAMTHALLTADNARKSAQHRPISEAYGQRHTLEMFGVSQFGIVATRSKEPVGNGSKIYIH